MSGVWGVGPDRSLMLDRARVIAVLNVTPDSFSDGGRIATPADALSAARSALEAGADMLDIGGESTRPGAERVGAAEQMRRVVPVVEAIRAAGIDAPISVDTTLARVAEAALDAGADAINDVSAGMDDPEMFPLAVRRRAGIVLMHRLVSSERDRYSDRYAQPPEYGSESEGHGVVSVVREFLLARAEAAMRAGIARRAIVLDPGLGFGKSVEQNYRLIAATREFVSLGFPVLSAASRKSFVGAAGGGGAPVDRVAGSVGVSVVMRLAGAALFRVHDVAEQAQALRVADRVRGVEWPENEGCKVRIRGSLGSSA